MASLSAQKCPCLFVSKRPFAKGTNQRGSLYCQPKPCTLLWKIFNLGWQCMTPLNPMMTKKPVPLKLGSFPFPDIHAAINQIPSFIGMYQSKKRWHFPANFGSHQLHHLPSRWGNVWPDVLRLGSFWTIKSGYHWKKSDTTCAQNSSSFRTL